MALRIAKDVDPMKVRGVKIMKKQAPLYRQVKKYRLMNQIPLSDMQSLSTDETPKKIKSSKSSESDNIDNSQKSDKTSKIHKTNKSCKSDKSDKSDEPIESTESESESEKQKIVKPERPKKIENDKRENNTDLREDIEYIIKETDHLDYLHRKEILTMILDQGYSEFVSESSDGTRIDMSKLPVDMINQIKNFVSVKLKTIDITDRFESLYNEKKDEKDVLKTEKSTDNTKKSKTSKKEYKK